MPCRTTQLCVYLLLCYCCYPACTMDLRNFQRECLAYGQFAINEVLSHDTLTWSSNDRSLTRFSPLQSQYCKASATQFNLQWSERQRPANPTTLGISITAHRSDIDEEPPGVLHNVLDALQEGDSLAAINQAVVICQGHVHDGPRNNLLAHYLHATSIFGYFSHSVSILITQQ